VTDVVGALDISAGMGVVLPEPGMAGATDLPGMEATDLPGMEATDLPGMEATDLPGMEATDLPGIGPVGASVCSVAGALLLSSTLPVACVLPVLSSFLLAGAVAGPSCPPGGSSISVFWLIGTRGHYRKKPGH
jgi:hypothetical protein